MLGQTCGLLPVGIDFTVLTTRGLRWNLSESMISTLDQDDFDDSRFYSGAQVVFRRSRVDVQSFGSCAPDCVCEDHKADLVDRGAALVASVRSRMRREKSREAMKVLRRGPATKVCVGPPSATTKTLRHFCSVSIDHRMNRVGLCDRDAVFRAGRACQWKSSRTMFPLSATNHRGLQDLAASSCVDLRSFG